MDEQARSVSVGFALGPEESRAGSVAGVTLFKARGADTGGAYAAFTQSLRPGFTATPHIHHDHAEAFTVLHGELAYLMGDRTVRATAGSFVFVPAGTIHAIRNEGDQTARMLVIVSPADLEAYFEEIARLVAVGVRLDSPEVAAVRARYRYEVIARDW